MSTEEQKPAGSVTLRKLRERFAGQILETHSYRGDDTATVARGEILAVAEFLKTDPELRYEFLMDLAGVDYYKRKPRFEVVYHFYSLTFNHRVRVKVPLEEADPEVDSLIGLWKGANWYEREAWDMYGIRFRGHPDLRRILLYPEFQGHALRKDYPIRRRQPLIGPKN